MKSEYIPLDDPRVVFTSCVPGKIFNEQGTTVTERLPYKHTVNDIGAHQEPRMPSVFAPIKTFNMGPGDFAEILVRDIPLIGFVLELAEHHYDVDLYIDNEKIYGEFYCISTYMPSSDGFGKIHWLMIDRGEHKVRIEVGEKYNRMLDISGTKPTHTCINGFLLMGDIVFPPPIYNTWMYGQDKLPGDWLNGHSSLCEATVAPGGHLYLMDLYGQGSLETLAFQVDQPVVVEVIDGGTRQKEFDRDFPSWIRRIDLTGNPVSSRSVAEILKMEDGGYTFDLKKPAHFGSRLIVRLFNPQSTGATIEGFYMEGTMRCM